jgi:hypothetical protein
MKTRTLNQTAFARTARLLLTILTAFIVAGIFEPVQSHAENPPWCGPQSIMDAMLDTKFILEFELQDLDAQLAAETDPQAQTALLTQINNFILTIIALQQAILAYTGPCVIAEEECPTCYLAISQCAGHEELCPTCNLVLSQCAGHEELCPTCNLALSQCSGHEELCPTCNLALSQCSGHEAACYTCSQPVSQCYCPLP